MNAPSKWQRFFTLAGLLLAPYLLIFLLPGSQYPSQFHTGLDLIQLGKHHQHLDEQLSGVQKYLEVVPSQCLAHLQAGKLMHENQNDEQAIVAYKTAWQAGCLDEEGMLDIFRIEKQTAKADAAVDMTLWLSNHPQSGNELYQVLILQYQENGLLVKASETALNWVRAQPANQAAINQVFHYAALVPMDVRYELAREYTNGQINLAQETQAIISAIILSTGESEDIAAYRLGNAYSNFSIWDMAEICFQQSVDLEADRTEAWVYLAITRKNQGKNTAAAIIEAQKRAVDRDIVRSLYGIYWRDTNPEIAYVYWMKLVAAQPEVPEWPIEVGAALAQMGDLDAALVYYDQAVAIDPNRTDIRAAFARFCLMYEIDIPGRGLDQTRAMIRLEPEHATGYLLEGQMLLHEEDFITAERMFLKAKSLDQQSAEASYYLGMLYRALGEPIKARMYFEQASQLNDPYYQRAAALMLATP